TCCVDPLRPPPTFEAPARMYFERATALRWVAFTASLAACVVFLSACSGPSTSQGNILLRGNGPDPDSLDPQLARAGDAQVVLRDLCEGLTTLAKDASTAPGVATAWTASADGKTYTFNLRDNARWSNGDPVVASDFVAGLRRLVDPATASQYAQIIDV